MGYLCLSNMAASRMAARLLGFKGNFLRSTGNSAAVSQVQSLFKRSFMSTGTNTVIFKGFCRLQGVANAFVSKSNHQVMPAAQLILNTQSTTFSTLQNQIKAKGVLSPKVGWSFASGVRYLPTLNQIRRQKPRSKNTQPKPYIPKSERVLLGPQRKGVCIKVFIRKPKKPNSAQRKCALLKLSNGKTISAYIPHEKGQLQEHGVVLFEGGRVQDCPGIKYKIIRGKLDMN